MTTSIPPQYQTTSPTIQNANLSPLQLAASYYMAQGQQTPFFVNHDWLRALSAYADSGLITPASVGVPEGLSVVAEEDSIYVIRKAPDCGPEENRYEKVYVGTRNQVAPGSWSFNGMVIRGGSAANGAGGPWGTGGLSSQDPTPGNSVDRQPNIVGNIITQYSANVSTASDNIA